VRRDGWGFSREAFREVRADSGLSVEELARRSGISPGHVRAIGEGVRQPEDDEVQALADALGVDAWVLLWQ
jgi:transcriptional regulator with XRE-family HTH domain